MIKDTSEGQTQPVVTGRITFGPVPAQHGELEQLRAENAELRKRCEEQDRQIAILEAKNKGTLANNLCPDCRDKQVGKPCMGCTIQTSEKRVVVATEALEYYAEYYQGNGIDIPDDSLRARMALAALKEPKS